jgi:hypothetical protein
LLERDGHGDFTRHVMEVLARDVPGLSNGEFAARVTRAFGRPPRQHAKLYSSAASRARGLLQPLGSPARGLSSARR